MSVTNNAGWKLEELAQRAGVSPRTIRYYVQRGLLPAPAFRGRGTVYTDEHLIKLKVIHRLQKQFLPLDRIQHELATRSLRQLQETAAGGGEVGLMRQRVGERRLVSQPRQAALEEPQSKRERWLRWVLAPGLELHVAETADPETRRQAEQLGNEFRRRQHEGGKQ
jgi:DNA-binding transcriptional MerR regulator